ncbi:cytochrome b [Rhodopseudomonas sp. NSM]|uniref:cytochrome b n=1 Tax=Rhodopseudomonas sp. NSM TaxID=3457630 RepID=UPI0040359E18
MISPIGYSRVQIALHWVVVALVAAQYIFKDSIANAWMAWQQELPFAFDPRILAHIVVGMLILLLIGWRLVLRAKLGTPSPPEDEPAPMRTIAQFSHASFYVVLAAMSVSGVIAWFGDVAPAAQLHNLLKLVLLGLIALHVLAALLHHVVLKTDVMRRMVRPQA